MLKRERFIGAVYIVLFSWAAAWGQSSEWKVNREWVYAHEMFLASDAMRGRASASPDEWIAATYVASEFEKYGLKPGFADGNYIQRGELVQPVRDGKSTIRAAQNPAFTSLKEGKDFTLARTDGDSISGALQKLDDQSINGAQVHAGAIVLLTAKGGDPAAGFIRIATRAGAKALLITDPSLTLEALQASVNEGRQVRPHVAGMSQPTLGGSICIIRLTTHAADRIAKLPEGAMLSLDINTKDTPRYTYNAVGVLPGKDTNAKVILLSAHLDHVGIGQAVNGDSIYNGANDDASGTVAVLELAHALAAGPTAQRTIYFVCYGSEELGGLGSTYFREHSPIPIERIAANLEFEMIGNQDPKMPKGRLLLTGWDRSNLGPTLAQHGAQLGDDPYPEQRFFERSDNYPLALKGVVAHTAAGWGTPPTYHKPNDDLAHLDFPFLTQAIQSLIEPIRWLANSDFVPTWLPGKEPLERR